VQGGSDGFQERAGLAPQASRHNNTPEAGLTAGAVVVMGAGGGLAAALDIGLAGAVVGGVEGEAGLAAGFGEQALTAATARPAVPASSSNRRGVSSGAPRG
jgi:hypothetical protein